MTRNRHKPRFDTRTHPEARAQDGMHLPAMTLHRVGCTCGWEGTGWYATRRRARSEHDHHLRAQEQGR